jgi:general secretion pathway protein N
MNPRLAWLGVAAFALALIVMLPVRWIAWMLPAQVQCARWSGSVWRGQCSGLVLQQGDPALAAEMLRWTLHPASLLRLTIKATISVRTDQGTGSGVAEVGRNGRLAVEDLAVSALFDRRLATMLAEGWRGQLETKDLTVRLHGNTLQALHGEIALLDFMDAQGVSLGSYRLTFPRAAAPPFIGTLQDTAGPLAFTASVTIHGDRRWQLEGLITPRPDASPALRNRLEILGAADSSGRYRLSSEGTFK